MVDINNLILEGHEKIVPPRLPNFLAEVKAEPCGNIADLAFEPKAVVVTRWAGKATGKSDSPGVDACISGHIFSRMKNPPEISARELSTIHNQKIPEPHITAIHEPEIWIKGH